MRLSRRIFAAIAALLAVAAAMAVKVEDVENVHVADRTRYVTDQAGVLSAGARQQADSILGDIWRLTGAEPVLVIVDSTDGENVDDYATELFSRWGIGKKDRDNGLLILISIGDRRNVFRTGYSTEPVLPDAACWTISREYMNPRFKESDYDGGILAGLEKVREAMTSDEAREELQSEIPNDAGASDGEDDNFFAIWLWTGGAVCLMLLFVVVWLFFASRGKSTVQAYGMWDRMLLPALILTVLFVGIPLPALLIICLKMRHIRLRKHTCPNCGTAMRRLDEVTDNQYLTPSQDLEEHLKSVDYDVWLCPKCGERDIIPYVNPRSNYRECPVCHTHAERFIGERVVSQPTALRDGLAVKEYECTNCHNRRVAKTVLPKTPPIIIGGGGNGGGFGGGGFSGGSFGGGMTGGGGSSTGW